MRVAVVDIGTNSTRLLVAHVGADGAIQELRRESTVTRLGEGVEATGRLGELALDPTSTYATEHLAKVTLASVAQS